MPDTFHDFPIYCINLKHNEERKYYIDLQCKRKPIKFVEAVYGKKLDQKKLERLTENSVANNYTDDLMKPNEIGCLLSHIEVFKESLKNPQEDYIIVLEDDVDITSFMSKKMEKHLCSIVTQYECIQLCIIVPDYVDLPDNSSNETPILQNWNEKSKLHHPWGYMWSTGCYIISRSARQTILDHFERGVLLKPADYFIYEHLNTYTMFPPIVLPNLVFDTDIGDSLNHQHFSKNRIIQKYYKRRLILIAVWFGKLPKYFGLWMYSLRNQKYDVLLITDQDIPDYPDNIRILFMHFSDFNNHLKIKTKWNVRIRHPSKLVDVKPLLGFLFYDFIAHYDYWGWTDVDMIMGDVLQHLDDEEIEVVSFGFDSFGPMMLFKTSIVDLHTHIEHYEDMLKDEYICKVDEPWWYVKSKNNKQHLTICKDENTIVRYYEGNNLIDFVQTKNLKVVDWPSICVGIDWEIKEGLITNPSAAIESDVYRMVDHQLFKNGTELAFCHLTLLKMYKPFCDYVSKHIHFGIPNRGIEIRVDYKYNDVPISPNLDIFTIYELYYLFMKVNICVKNI
jgi:GR25 family glycosyltransferase involved in LPS biosynthesis